MGVTRTFAVAGATTGDPHTFENVCGDHPWTLVCLGGAGGFRILRNGIPFTTVPPRT